MTRRPWSCLGDQRLGLCEGAIGGVYVALVDDVVAGVGHRRRVPGLIQMASTPRSRTYPNRLRRPAMSPTPSPFPSAKLRKYTW